MTARGRVLVVAFAACACGVSSLAAQPLGDVARKEEQRRKVVKSSAKVYTNTDLGPGATAPVTPPPASQVAGPGGTPQPATARPADAPAQDDPKKTEAYWRDRIETARSELQGAQLALEAFQSRVNALNTDFVNRDDPAQRAVIANDRQKALAELERVKDSIGKLKQMILDIEEEARRAGVPPGWIR